MLNSLIGLLTLTQSHVPSVESASASEGAASFEEVLGALYGKHDGERSDLERGSTLETPPETDPMATDGEKVEADDAGKLREQAEAGVSKEEPLQDADPFSPEFSQPVESSGQLETRTVPGDLVGVPRGPLRDTSAAARKQVAAASARDALEKAPTTASEPAGASSAANATTGMAEGRVPSTIAQDRNGTLGATSTGQTDPETRESRRGLEEGGRELPDARGPVNDTRSAPAAQGTVRSNGALKSGRRNASAAQTEQALGPGSVELQRAASMAAGSRAGASLRLAGEPTIAEPEVTRGVAKSASVPSEKNGVSSPQNSGLLFTRNGQAIEQRVTSTLPTDPAVAAPDNAMSASDPSREARPAAIPKVTGAAPQQRSFRVGAPTDSVSSYAQRGLHREQRSGGQAKTVKHLQIPDAAGSKEIGRHRDRLEQGEAPGTRQVMGALIETGSKAPGSGAKPANMPMAPQGDTGTQGSEVGRGAEWEGRLEKSAQRQADDTVGGAKSPLIEGSRADGYPSSFTTERSGASAETPPTAENGRTSFLELETLLGESRISSSQQRAERLGAARNGGARPLDAITKPKAQDDTRGARGGQSVLIASAGQASSVAKGGPSRANSGSVNAEIGSSAAPLGAELKRGRTGHPDIVARVSALGSKRPGAVAKEVVAASSQRAGELLAKGARDEVRDRPAEPFETRPRNRVVAEDRDAPPRGMITSAKASAPMVSARAPKIIPEIGQTGLPDVTSPVIEPLPADPLSSATPGEPRSTALASHAGSFAPVTRDTATLLRQASEALTAAADAQGEVIELKLKPEELGQLRFRIGQGETGLVLSLSADRPETLDLLRRHVDQLARHLSDLGYGSASFSFSDGQGQAGPGAGQGSAPMVIDEVMPAAQEAPARASVVAAPKGLDLRL